MQTPTANSLLIADRVYRDAESRKWVISGVFNTLGFRAFPGVHDWMEVFFQLTNVSREVDLRFRVENTNDGSLLVELKGQIGSPSPLNVLEQKIVMRGLRFPGPGKYWVQLVSDEAIVAQTPLYVRELKPQPRGGPEQRPGSGPDAGWGGGPPSGPAQT
jgi:hypothetical protein